jgi:hypothetical protein
MPEARITLYCRTRERMRLLLSDARFVRFRGVNAALP